METITQATKVLHTVKIDTTGGRERDSCFANRDCDCKQKTSYNDKPIIIP
jgi:hypothetical protein